MVRWAAACAAVSAGCALTACTSSHAGAPVRTSRVPAPSRSGVSAQSLVLTDAQNGRVVRAHVGDRLRVQLGSTYWRFDAPSGPQLRPAGRPSFAPGPSCVPGGGCGYVAQVYDVVAAGTAQLSASRTTCGEVLRCRPDQRTFRITVIVRS